jgi:2-methylcitrate dehydratase PrpD
MAEQKDLAFTVAKRIADCKFEDIPAASVEASKKIILDQFSVALPGSTAGGVPQTVEQMKDWGGKPESTIWVYGDKVPAPNAAFANAMMAHGWDSDDTYVPAIIHIGAPTVPVAFAMAERKGGLNGKDLLTAVNIGINVMCVLSKVVKGDAIARFHATCLQGGFGATAAAGWILGLDEEKMRHALGINYGQSSGNLQGGWDGAHTKRMSPAFAVRAGILSALLASRGVTGAHNVFEGLSGFFNVYIGGEYNREIVEKQIGKVFDAEDTTFKLHPG